MLDDDAPTRLERRFGGSSALKRLQVWQSTGCRFLLIAVAVGQRFTDWDEAP
jgi:hypothetical protein